MRTIIYDFNKGYQLISGILGVHVWTETLILVFQLNTFRRRCISSMVLTEITSRPGPQPLYKIHNLRVFLRFL